MKTLISFLTFICMILSVEFSFSQTVTVSGYVLNGQTGEFIKSASVFESSDGIGTISNSSGFYKLVLKPGEKEFKISDSGFQEFSKSFVLSRDTVLTVKLEPLGFEKSQTKNEPAFQAVQSDNEAAQK